MERGLLDTASASWNSSKTGAWDHDASTQAIRLCSQLWSSITGEIFPPSSII